MSGKQYSERGSTRRSSRSTVSALQNIQVRLETYPARLLEALRDVAQWQVEVERLRGIVDPPQTQVEVDLLTKRRAAQERLLNVN